MHAFLSFIAQHWTAAGFGSGAVLIAFATCLPEKRPRTLDDFYAYFRESVQTVIPAGRRRPMSSPDGPAKESGE